MLLFLLNFIYSQPVISKIIKKTKLLNGAIDLYISNVSLSIDDLNKLEYIKKQNNILIRYVIDKVKKYKIFTKKGLLNEINKQFKVALIKFTEIFKKFPITDKNLKEKICKKIWLYQYIKIDEFTLQDNIYIRNRFYNLNIARHTIFLLMLNIHKLYSEDENQYKYIDTLITDINAFVELNLILIGLEINNNQLYLNTKKIPFTKTLYFIRNLIRKGK